MDSSVVALLREYQVQDQKEIGTLTKQKEIAQTNLNEARAEIATKRRNTLENLQYIGTNLNTIVVSMKANIRGIKGQFSSLNLMLEELVKDYRQKSDELKKKAKCLKTVWTGTLATICGISLLFLTTIAVVGLVAVVGPLVVIGAASVAISSGVCAYFTYSKGEEFECKLSKYDKQIQRLQNIATLTKDAQTNLEKVLEDMENERVKLTETVVNGKNIDNYDNEQSIKGMQTVNDTMAPLLESARHNAEVLDRITQGN